MNSYDSYDPYMPPVLYDYCESPDHNAYACPYHEYIDVTCASFEKKIKDMTEQMMETMKVRIAKYSQSFNQIRETSIEIDSSLGSPKLDISLYDDFEPSYSAARPDLNENMSLPSLEQENDLRKSLLTDLAPCIGSTDNVIEDILVYVDIPTTLNDFREFEVGEQSDTVSESDTSIAPAVKLHDLDDMIAISQELCNEITEPIILDFDDDILYAEYEFFSYGLDVTEGFDVGFHVEYQTFSFGFHHS